MIAGGTLNTFGAAWKVLITYQECTKTKWSFWKVGAEQNLNNSSIKRLFNQMFFVSIGRTIVFSQSSGVSLDGHVMLFTGDVQRTWLDVSQSEIPLFHDHSLQLCVSPTVHQEYSEARWISTTHTGIWKSTIASATKYPSCSKEIYAKSSSCQLCSVPV